MGCGIEVGVGEAVFTNSGGHPRNHVAQFLPHRVAETILGCRCHAVVVANSADVVARDGRETPTPRVGRPERVVSVEILIEAPLIRGSDGEAYNIGVAEPEISTRTLAEKVIEHAGELFGYEGKISFGKSEDQEYLVNNPNRRCPDIRKAQQELDYHPGISIDEGLRRSLIWYRENQSGEAS